MSNRLEDTKYLLPFQAARALLGKHLSAVQSVKFMNNELSQNRYYSCFDRNESARIQENSMDFYKTISLPKQAGKFLQSHFDEYVIWSIGVSENGNAVNYKIYLHSIKNDHDIPIIAVEWHPGGEQFIVKDYIAQKLSSKYEVRQIVRDILYKSTKGMNKARLESLYEIFYHILEQSNYINVTALKVKERNRARISMDFDLGIHQFISFEDLRPYLDNIANLFNIAEEVYFAWLGNYAVKDPFRIAIGQCNINSPFITFYERVGKKKPNPYVFNKIMGIKKK